MTMIITITRRSAENVAPGLLLLRTRLKVEVEDEVRLRVRQNRATELALRGGRQGCILGGTICNPSYGRASEAFYERAEAEHLPVKENSAPNALDDDKTKDAVVLDVTFVDDEAIAVLASVPATLTQKLSRIITVLRAAFAEVEG